MATTGSYITQGGYPCSAPPLSRAWRSDQPLPRPHPVSLGDKARRRHGLRCPGLADRGGADLSSHSTEIPILDCGGGRKCATPGPLPEADPCLSGASQPCGGVEATGAPRVPKSPRLCAHPLPKWKPRGPVSPSQSPLPAHLIEGPVARGRAEGSPAENPASARGAVLHGGTGSTQARLRGQLRAHGGQRGGIPRPPREPAL